MEQLMYLKIQTWKADKLRNEHKMPPRSHVSQGAENAAETN